MDTTNKAPRYEGMGFPRWNMLIGSSMHACEIEDMEAKVGATVK